MEFLAPYNFAIGVKGGTNFIYHTVSLEIDKYITRTQEELRTNPPTRCLISLDMVNFFNEISRTRTIDIIKTHFPHLVGTINLLIKNPTNVFFTKTQMEYGITFNK